MLRRVALRATVPRHQTVQRRMNCGDVSKECCAAPTPFGSLQPATGFEAFKFGTAGIIAFFLMLDGSVCKTVFGPARRAICGCEQ